MQTPTIALRARTPEIRRCSAMHAFRWIAAGWRQFCDNPLQWLLLSFVVFAVMTVISLLIVPVPVLGPMVPPVVFAIVLGSLLDASERVSHGGELLVADCFRGSLPWIGSLATVGVFFAIPLVLVQLLVWLAITGSLLVGVFGAALGSALNGLFGAIANSLSTLLAGGAVLLFLWLLMLLTLIFSPALIVLARQSAFDAMTNSLRGSLRNLGAVLLFGVCVYALFVVAMAPLGLGVLVFIPVFIGALRQACHDMFGLAEVV